MTRKRVLLLAGFGLFGIAASAQTFALGRGDAAQSAPAMAQTTQRFPQFENEHVRVWKTVIMPNQPLTMHRHEFPRTLVALVVFGVGFLVAAKSVFRFGELTNQQNRLEAEYITIGTLMSFSWGLGTSLVVRLIIAAILSPTTNA